MFFERHNHNLYVHGYREYGDITISIDMRVLIQLDRFDLVKEAVINLPDGNNYKDIAEEMDYLMTKQNVCKEDSDLPEVEEWEWKKLR